MTRSRLGVALAACATFMLAAALASAPAQAAAEVNVYSARQENLIKPLLKRFTAKTGIAFNLITGKADALIVRLAAEGRASPADLLITTDVGRLHRAKLAGVLQPARSAALQDAIAPRYRDPDGHWFGLSLRARVIMAARGRADPARLQTYAALADPRWRGRVCVRSSSNIYNQSLVASFIAADGPDRTLAWARGLAANFARKPTGGDRDQLLAVAGGLCDVALANTYYLEMMRADSRAEHRRAAAAIEVVWPDQNGRGAHVNLSGAGVARWAPHRDNAVRLLEHLASPAAQEWYARVNHEYPVSPAADSADPRLRHWATVKRDEANLGRLGELNTAAVKLMDRAGWE